MGITQPPLKRSEVRRFTRRIKINYPILLGTNEISTLFDAGEILPVTFIVDRAGKVRERIVGILEPEEFDEKVKPLLHDSGSRLSATSARGFCQYRLR